VATTVTSRTATWAATTWTAATTTPAIAITITASAAGTPFTGSTTFGTRGTCLDGGNHSVYAIEVRLVIGVEIRAAFDDCGRRSLRYGRRQRRRLRRGSTVGSLIRVRRRSPTHFGALLLQDRLARQLDAVTFDGQNFHEHLVAFFQFIANIFDSVFGNLADVEQSVQAGQNLDERSEIR
jgi:hypothetical protein